ncbi:GDSL-type esterase/lipase family protein [Vitiosangium sp. GDMCC 1.1324]|uniref:SGNH/GDSL hydrolase family protein n=1 Tax=Vitiosangium sp. (strain GDMCC 1.1324) TaxID=2138576 RepID=UPI000D3AECF9|nr:GDSL-type esterase/lipase family protein [Vitiosangium sp. GDMCC 1.1324]PTL76706.1 GDSL family lipase [Vitiosangium sp. GDMCC 1.1324]
MAGRRRIRLLVCAWAILMAGCGSSEDTREETFPETPEAPEAPPPEDNVEDPLPDGGLEVAPIGDDPESQPRPMAPLFQPGFHQALRWSYSTGSVTFRLRVPVGRAGQRVRLAFLAGDGNLVLNKATVARAGTEGSLASAPVTVTFSGAPGFSVGASTRVVSDPVSFPVGFRDELAVSFEVQGELAVSAIEALPGSYVRSGAYASVTDPIGGTPWARAVGLATVDVEGPPARAFVALGDSITEGYITDHDDTRLAWPSVAEKQLGVPIVNAGVSGEGFYEELMNLDQEVLSLEGITDCIVLLGTNDLAGLDLAGLESRMNTLVSRLKPFCRTWVGTLLPKEKSNHGDYEVVKRDRLAFNAWVRATFPDLIDFEAVTRQPNNVHLFIDGLEVDGIHPSAEGHRVMAAEVVRVLREAGVQAEEGVQLPAAPQP